VSLELILSPRRDIRFTTRLCCRDCVAPPNCMGITNIDVDQKLIIIVAKISVAVEREKQE
jgi:hypothetical protein